MFKETIAKLSYLSELVDRIDMARIYFTLTYLSSFEGGINTYEESYLKLIEEYNANKYWWMCKIKPDNKLLELEQGS